jgi:hypothetical protein
VRVVDTPTFTIHRPNGPVGGVEIGALDAVTAVEETREFAAVLPESRYPEFEHTDDSVLLEAIVAAMNGIISFLVENKPEPVE